MTDNLIALAIIYGQLSLVAFGGGNSVVGDMQRQVVEVHGWMSAQEFVALYALAQAAPGPNMLIASLIGWRVAGFSGAMVATLSMCAPSGILVLTVSSAWFRFRDAPWRKLIQAGITPVTAGLVMAAAVLLTRSSTVHWQHAVLTLLAMVPLFFTKWHPLLVLAAGAAAGALGLLG